MVFTDESIPFLVRGLLGLHVSAGAIALLLFLVPLLTRKGGKIHIQIGKVYALGMALVGLTAFPITFWRGVLDHEKSLQSQTFAAFLFFIAVLSLASLWFGLRTLKEKKRSRPDLKVVNIGLPCLLLATALMTIAVGFYFRDSLLTYFPIVGVLTAVNQLRYWLTAPTLKMHWWYAHMSGKFVASISTITAFLVTALPRLFPEQGLESSVLLWLSPTILLVPILEIWTFRYKKKFGDVRAQ